MTTDATTQKKELDTRDYPDQCIFSALQLANACNNALLDVIHLLRMDVSNLRQELEKERNDCVEYAKEERIDERREVMQSYGLELYMQAVSLECQKANIETPEHDDVKDCFNRLILPSACAHRTEDLPF